MSAPTLPALLVSHWQLDPLPAAGLGACASAYLLGAARLGARWPARRSACFAAGLLTVLVALSSGLASYDERLLSAHMVQHMLLLLMAPLLLLEGRPLNLVLRLVRGESRRRLARGLKRFRPFTRAWQCLGAFAAVVLLTHLPAFYDATLRHPLVHDGEHLGYLLAGTLMWWPLLGAEPVRGHRLSGFGRLLYLLLAMLPMALVGAYMNRHTTVIYAAYTSAAHALGVSATADQAQAGAIMWVVGNTVMVVVGLWAIMAAMSEEERRQQARDLHAAARALAPPLDGGPER